MDFKIGIVIGASLWLVTEQEHHNERACTSLTAISEPCGCILINGWFEPICGSDGRTYLGICFLQCRNALAKNQISVAYNGICKQETRCNCHGVYEPVCGTDEVTYPNECVMNCYMNEDNSMEFQHDGECVTEQGKLIVFDPIHPENASEPGCCCYRDYRRFRTRFGNNGKRYVRTCRCGCPHKRKIEAPQTPPARLTQTNRPGSCRQQRTSSGCPTQSPACPLTAPMVAKSCSCVSLHRPVCSSNYKTFVNLCMLQCTSRNDPSIKFKSWGVCGYNHLTQMEKNTLYPDMD